MQLLKAQTGRVLIEAHRGVQDGVLQENSWMAIEEAAKQKADFIELDVQLSRDLVPFIRHDYSIADGRLVGGLDWKEIRTLESEEEPPLLIDVLIWAKENDAHLSLDLKTGFLSEYLLEKHITAEIDKADCWDRVMLIAWDHHELLEVKKAFPKATTRILIIGRPIELVDLVKKAEADAVSLSYGIVRPNDVSALHSIGIAVLLAEMWQLDVPVIKELDVDLISWGKPKEARGALGLQ